MSRVASVSALLGLALVGGSAVAASHQEPFPYRVVDRRAMDGSVLLVHRVPRDRPGSEPFVAAAYWELTPASTWLELHDLVIRARPMAGGGDPPNTVVEDGQGRRGAMPDLFGTHVEVGPGEPLRLLDVNAALGSIRIDVETVCRSSGSGKRFRGRITFPFEGQVKRDSLDRANEIVGRNLRPMPLHRVAEHCHPYDGTPPVVLRVGALLPHDRLGEPETVTQDGVDELLDYGPVVIRSRGGEIVAIGIPALD